MDFGKYLPLSQRRDDAEGPATSDRRDDIARLVERALQLVLAAPVEDGDELARRFARGSGLIAEQDAASFDVVALGALGALVRAGRKKGAAALARVVRAVLALADECGAPAEIDPLVLGAAALYAATSGPFDRRAAIKGHLVRATDAD